MEFEWDPAKSASNAEKHGVSFEEATHLWDGPTYEVETKAHNDDVRWLVMGVMRGKYWTAVTTEREGRTRIISVRRSRDYEEEAYDEHCL